MRKREDQGQKAGFLSPNLMLISSHLATAVNCTLITINKGEKQGCFSYCGTVFFLTGKFKSSYMSLDGLKTHQVLKSLPGESHSK